jgi:hypothetical protein
MRTNYGDEITITTTSGMMLIGLQLLNGWLLLLLHINIGRHTILIKTLYRA